MEVNRIIEEFFEANVTPEIDRLVDLSIGFFDVMEVNYKGWPKEVKKIIRKRGGIDRLRIKDLVKIEQILNFKFIKISKL